MKKLGRPSIGFLMTLCLLAAPLTAFAKKGEKNFRQGLQYEASQKWELAAQEFTLALAANPADADYRLHYQRSVFNASQSAMQKGRALAEHGDYVGAYNAFRQANGYDPANELALSEMERMKRLQREKTGDVENAPADTSRGVTVKPTSFDATPQSSPRRSSAIDPAPSGTEQLRVINYTGDLKSFIRTLADQLGLNVIFDSQSFRQPKTIEINLKDVTTAQALDWVFLQEGLFFQKLSRRTIIVADQNRRPQYQQLVIRTFYLSNADPNDARQVITQAIPPQQGRPQTIVIPDKATNSLTIRDTAENVRLIEDILRSLDKDRAEVVMDVNIYEVSSEDVFQLGNQVGAADSGAVLTLGTASSLSTIAGSRQVATQVANLPTALGAALILPQSQFIALQRKGNTRLLASTQVHAFTGEESTARIGQRVPVQTAQTYPVGNYGTTPTTGGTGGTTSGVFGGGFPVIQYEPTGLTLKFTPIVFPNLDVQVKMSIESKDVLNASLTPTFTERTISGTARVQNNRTMMLASVAQDRASDGRQGIPFLGLVPILGRLFTAPRRDNTRTDVVIAVTPRVLRAPSLTPEDERPRESGTLSTPTAGSLEALVQEATREEQLAAARKIPTNPVVQLPDADLASYIPAPTALANSPAATGKTEPTAPSAVSKALDTSYKPAPGSSLADKLAATVGTSNDKVNNVSETAKPANGSGASLADKIRAATDLTGTVSPVSEIKLLPERNEFKVGEKQRVAVTLSTSQALGPLMLKLTFDPRTITVKDVIAGEPATSSSPTVMKSIDPKGSITVAVSPQSGVISATGSTFLLFLDIEAVGTGDATLSFDKASSRITLSQGGEASSQLGEVHILVK